MRKIIGHHAIREFLKVRPRAIEKVFFKSDWEKNSDLQEQHELIKKYTKNIDYIGVKKLDQECPGHQGALIYAQESPEISLQDLADKESALVLLLDGIQDPQNIGAITRSAWLMGADVIYLPQKRSAYHSPAAHKVASGGMEHVAIEQVSQLQDIIKELQGIGFWAYAFDQAGEQSLYQTDLPKKTAVVLGSEEKGIKKSALKASDQTLFIPQKDRDASYNVSVSAAIAMAEYSRQHS
tara:strand:- start:15963 stop:16676 length:714 start_codon:yes stop_codon:yes gene_type:complete